MFKFYILLFCIISLCACNASESSEKFEKEKKIIYKEVEPSQVYESCKIGGQTWMAQNLNEPHFKNGDPITEAKSAEDWKKAGNSRKPAWCYYNNDPKNAKKLGKLYNWYAVHDPRGLAPEGWRLPTDHDWLALMNELKKRQLNALSLEHPSFAGNSKEANILNFQAFASGYRKESAVFANIGIFASFWSKSSNDASSAYALHLNNKVFELQWSKYYKSGGFSVRCLKIDD